jgi:hypothetical protein
MSKEKGSRTPIKKRLNQVRKERFRKKPLTSRINEIEKKRKSKSKNQ